MSWDDSKAAAVAARSRNSSSRGSTAKPCADDSRTERDVTSRGGTDQHHGERRPRRSSLHPARNGSARTPYTPVGLQLPARLTFERWHALGRRIGTITNASSWWLGDWAFYGEGSYGEKYKQAIAVTGLDYQTLRNYAWVAGRFDLSRRRDKLSFGHHAELAALPEHEQDDWLDQAENNRWSRNELRTHLRQKKQPRIPGNVEHLRLNVDTTRAERWKAAAEAEQLALTDWLVATADNAARHAVVSLVAATSTERPTG